MLLGSISWSKKLSLVQAVPDRSYPAQAMRLGNKLNEALGVCSRWVLWDMIKVQERLGWLLFVVIMVVPGWFWLLVNQYIDHHLILIIMSQSDDYWMIICSAKSRILIFMPDAVSGHGSTWRCQAAGGPLAPHGFRMSSLETLMQTKLGFLGDEIRRIYDL